MEELSKVRHKGILKLVDEKGIVFTEDLAEVFRVTPQTIRRDLLKLEKMDLLCRFHGGGRSLKPSQGNQNSEKDIGKNFIAASTAKLAAQLVPNGSSLFLSSGTKSEAIANALLDHEALHIATNNIHAASILCRHSGFQIMVPEGQIGPEDGAIKSLHAAQIIDNYCVDIAIIEAGGIDEKGQLMDYNPMFVQLSQVMIRNAKKIILLTDTKSYGRCALHRIGFVSDIDVVVCSGSIPAKFKNLFESNSIKYVQNENL